jgi:hypothetical protein
MVVMVVIMVIVVINKKIYLRSLVIRVIGYTRPSEANWLWWLWWLSLFSRKEEEKMRGLVIRVIGHA